MALDDCDIHQLLANVQRPGRYVGQEWNSVRKEWGAVEATIALAYPDVYEIGMSNLGLALLYDAVNRDGRFLAERVFCPWADMEAAMRRSGTSLYSLESRHPIRDFDVLGVSLQYELTYTNVLGMLDLAGLPVWASERTCDMPLVIAGGSCTYNPEPMAPFFDLFVIGEGEQALLEVLSLVAEWKRERSANGGRTREDLLRRLAALDGIYVPSLYDVAYADDGRLVRMSAKDGAPRHVRKRFMPSLGPVPLRPIVPTIDVVHDRAMIEIQRGCGRGCRFCQAGMIYRPVRERPVQETIDAVHEVLSSTGHSEVGLVSLSSSDHRGIGEIIHGVMQREARQPVAISLPSLRIDSFSVELAQMIESHRKTGLTFAPEAGSQRLRDVINKGVSEDDLLRTAEAAFASGWRRIKLYFMLGLPTETEQDVLEIARLVRNLRALGRRLHRRIDIAVSAATFVPKPHTPFQWERLAAQESVLHAHALLRDALRFPNVQLSWPEWDSSYLEAVLSRGDRRLAPVIYGAWKRGARFDAWGEHFAPEQWWQAFGEAGLRPAMYADRVRDTDEVLPWSIIDPGVSTAFLASERARAYAGLTSPDCRSGCMACGIADAFVEELQKTPSSAWTCTCWR